jgi:hypothetical protein
MLRRMIWSFVVLTSVLGVVVTTSNRASAQFLVPTKPTPAPRFGLLPLLPTGPRYVHGDWHWLDYSPGHFQQACHYQVLVRHGVHWDIYATLSEPRDAERMARRLRLRGHEVRIVRVIY